MKRHLFVVAALVMVPVPTLMRICLTRPSTPEKSRRRGWMVGAGGHAGRAGGGPGVSRYWAVKKGTAVTSLLLRSAAPSRCTSTPTAPPTGCTSEGKLRCTIGKETMLMEPGDYMTTPPERARHRLERVGEGKTRQMQRSQVRSPHKQEQRATCLLGARVKR